MTHNKENNETTKIMNNKKVYSVWLSQNYSFPFFKNVNGYWNRIHTINKISNKSEIFARNAKKLCYILDEADYDKYLKSYNCLASVKDSDNELMLIKNCVKSLPRRTFWQAFRIKYDI